MDGDPVGEPSQIDGAGEKMPAHDTLADIFTALCPKYMAIGMSYSEYWNSNTKVHKAYRIAWMDRQRHRNIEMWRQGMYIYDAVLKIAPVLRPFVKGKVEPEKYPNEPYPLTEQEAQEREEMKRTERLKRFMLRLEEESKGVNSDGRN